MLKMMRNPIQHYEWGSRTALAALQNRPTPTERPEAELWMGAHPAAPSTVAGDDGEQVPLTDLIAADPIAAQGGAVAERFGTRLPYLMKVIAIAAPLSLQVHPSADQAAEGYAREQAAGIPADRANYRDAWPKPELLYALTDVQALCGFRPVPDALRLLDALDLPALAPVVDLLRAAAGGSAAAAAMRDALAVLVRWPAAERAELVAALRGRAGALARSSPEPTATDLRWMADLAGRYPHDPAVAGLALLDRLHLAPGEAIHLPAGQLHAYLSGTGVEIMGNSDNVLRAGLTTKRVDPDELLRIVDPSSAPARVTPAGSGPVLRYEPGAAEFALVRATVDGHPAVLRDPGPRVVLCVDGRVTLAAAGADPAGSADPAGGAGPAGSAGAGAGADRRCHLNPGASAFAPAAAGPLTLSGRGTVFVATVPPPSR